MFCVQVRKCIGIITPPRERHCTFQSFVRC